MRKLWTITLSLATVVALQAATSPVRLTVTKKEDKDYKTQKGELRHPHVAASRQKETSETAWYTVEVVNTTVQPLAKVQIRWAVLVDHPGKALRLVNGEQPHDLKGLEKFSFDAGPVEIRTAEGKIDGYCVEVLQDGKVIASDIRPADTKQRVEALIERRDGHKK